MNQTDLHSSRSTLVELRNLVGRAHAQAMLLYASTDVREILGTLQEAQTVITAALNNTKEER